tara:strand:- start:3130 stop:4032 length:903 start_codon:yes stop_codon:yes gene_type:complete
MKKLQKLGPKNYSNLNEIEKNPKVLVLVLCSRNYLSFLSSKVQKKIWKEHLKDFQIIHFIGQKYRDQRELDHVGDKDSEYLVVDTNDDYYNIAKKTFLALDNINSNYEYDFVFRTNTSSYINFKNLKEFVKKDFQSLDYSGSILEAVEGDTIASGAGIFLSKKNVELILQNSDYFDESLPDDVAISRVLKKFNIVPKDLNRINLKSVPSPKIVFNTSDFHYRCRLDPNYHRLLEPSLMRYLAKATKKIGFTTHFHYFVLKLIFAISNIKLLNKLLQKYYSFKFYGEIFMGSKLMYSNKKT